MKKYISVFIILLFFVWILPLGAFIRPDQEKKTCDGRRAICLCSHLLAKKMAKMKDKVFLAPAAASAHKQESSSGSSGPDFLMAAREHFHADRQGPYLQRALVIPDPSFIRSIDHVPKA